MTRVLHVIDSLHPGGAERDMATTVRGLEARGFRQAIHLLYDAGPLERLIPPQCRLFQYDGLEHLMLSCKVFQPDLILTWNDDAAVQMAPVAASFGIPFVHRIPNVPSAQYALHPKSLRHMQQLRHVLQSASHVCAVSDSAADDAAEYFRIERPSVVYNGFPLACASTDGGPRKIPGTTLIASVGRLAVEKGHRDLVDALPAVAAKHPSLRCWIVGVGPLQAELNEQIAHLGLEDIVTLQGYQEDVAGILEQADLFVMPSLYEGFGNALVEAMVAGLPIIASDLPVWRRDVLRGGSGAWLVPSGDVIAIGQAIEALVTDPSLRHQLGQQAKAASARFQVARMIDDYAALFDRFIYRAAA